MNDIEYKNNNEISILDKVQCYLPKLHVNGTTVGSLKSKSLKKLAEKFNELSIDTLMKIPSELFLECIDLIDT